MYKVLSEPLLSKCPYSRKRGGMSRSINMDLQAFFLCWLVFHIYNMKISPILGEGDWTFIHFVGRDCKILETRGGNLASEFT